MEEEVGKVFSARHFYLTCLFLIVVCSGIHESVLPVP